MKNLKVTKRDTEDSTEAARADGVMPAVYYGRETESTPVAVSMPDFIKLWNDVGYSSIFEIDVEGETRIALVQDIDLHPVTDQPIHADIYVIEEGQKITVDLPVSFAGDAPAVKNKGGLLVPVMRSVEVEAEPNNLPEELELDVSELDDFGSQATVGNINVPDGVEILADDGEVVVLIEEPTELEELEDEGEEEDEFGIDDIEVEGETDEDLEGEEAEEGEADAGDEA